MIEQDNKVIPTTPMEIVPSQSETRLMESIKDALLAQGVSSQLIAEKIHKMLSAKGVTNSGIEFDDNKTILETIKLVLKLGGIRGLSDAPQIAIFNNIPPKDEKLKY